MIVYKCDYCGKESSEDQYRTILWKYTLTEHNATKELISKDICDECVEKLFLKYNWNKANDKRD